MALSCQCIHVSASARRPSISPDFDSQKSLLSSTVKPLLKELQARPMRVDVPQTLRNASRYLLDAFVDLVFKFADQPLLPSQSNFAPVGEIGEAVEITSIEGEIPIDFPEGIYIRNGPNPLFGGLQSTVSVFGRSSEIWVEGEGMLHAVHFTKDSRGKWSVFYKNKYVDTETFRIEKECNRPSFLPAIEGDSPAILAAYLLNQLRFGKVNKDICNTNVFEHSGKVYSIAENHLPQEIDIFSLNTHGNWDVNGSWDRCFTAHPKRAPGTGELVITGVDAVKPFLVLGVVSADGKRLVHKVDLKLERSIICHEIGVTEQYNVIMDIPLVVDINRLVRGGPLIKYEKDGYARIGVMPRYGDSESIMWFDVQPHCIFHILNCFEEGEEVVVRGFRQLKAIIPGPDFGHNRFEWFSRGFKPINDESIKDGSFFSRLHEWRLNMVTGEAKERRLTGDEFSMDFPMINENYIGSRNNYGYAQVADSNASTSCALPKYGGVAKLCLVDQNNRISKNGSEEEMINVKYHKIGEKQFCTGAAFVARNGGLEEDDGWIVTFVHNEETNVSQVHIIDTKKFDGEAIVKITLPQRVPYGFHGTFISTIPKNV